MAILITGGAGYIGSHTCVELVENGYEIIIIDNFSNSNPQALENIQTITSTTITFYEMDLRSQKDLETVFENHAIEAVIHFAGFKAVGESVQEPLQYYQNNVAATLTLCEVMQKFGVNKLVFSSSATVYSSQNLMPLSENSPLGAINPYGRTKQFIEEILRDIAMAEQAWSISLLRYFNPVGAHPSGEIGEDPNGRPNNLMPFISQVAVNKLEELNVYGSDYPTKDGTGVRDYIHVVDLAKGHVLALEKVLQTTGLETYNLGTGRGYSVLEVVGAFERASGLQIPYTLTGRRDGDVAVCYADTSKAKRELNWEAKKGIEEMCADTWRWQKKYPNGYNSIPKKIGIS